MKKIAVALILALTLTLGGCATTAAKAPVPGSLNTFDADMYRGLADAQAAINSLKDDIASGKLVPTPLFKGALNQAITDYDAADALWQSYHAAAGSLPSAPVQAAITKVQGDVSGLGAAK